MAGHGNNPLGLKSWYLGLLGLISWCLGLKSFWDSNPGIQIARKCKGKNSQTGNQSGNGTGTVKKPKCTLCGGKHWNLMFCPKLPQYLPYGNSQVQAPASLCIKCMGTKLQNADQCTHVGSQMGA